MIAPRSMITTALVLVLAAVGVGAAAGVMAQSSEAPVELTTELLDHWLALMRHIGTASLDATGTGILAQQTDPARLDQLCSGAGFATSEECGCTVLYTAVLMHGFDRDALGFIDPAQALQRRISAALKRMNLSDADIQALARDRRTLFALRKALPKGVPPAHLSLIDGYVHERFTADVNLWRQLAVGMKAIEAAAIGNRCTRLPALTAPAR